MADSAHPPTPTGLTRRGFLRATAVTAATAASATALSTPAFAGPAAPPVSSDVAGIDWSRFTRGAPIDENARRMAAILLNANKYALTTWYDDRFGDQGTPRYLNFHGTGERQIRSPGCQALGVATSICTGQYRADATGVPLDQAREQTLRLVRSLARAHRANSPGGWGGNWQSAYWASQSGTAGWLLWDALDATDAEYVRRMVEFEADRFIGYDVPYWKDADGTVVYPGDTKAEENSWNAKHLQLAWAMMPRHPHAGVWMNKCLELMLAAYATPSDLADSTVLAGKPVSQWVNGSNITDDGTIINHGKVNPDYYRSSVFKLVTALVATLAGQPTPVAAFHHADLLYGALVNLNYPSPPYRAPGGTMYVPGSSEIYYPQGYDWGNRRRISFALLDATASAFGIDAQVGTDAAAWEALHAGEVLQMQSRFDDGRTYLNDAENRSWNREAAVSESASLAYLTKWLVHQQVMTTTNRIYPQEYLALDLGAVPDLIDLSTQSAAELPISVSAIGTGMVAGTVSLQTPAGWQPGPPMRRFQVASQGALVSVETPFRLVFPTGATPGTWPVAVRADSQHRTATAEFDVTLVSRMVQVDLAAHFDKDVISWQDNPCDGRFGPSQSYSYAAELLPDSGLVTLGGIPFTFPDKTDGANNAVSMNGQVLQVPRRRYLFAVILGASASGPFDSSAVAHYGDGYTAPVPLQFSPWGTTKPLQYGNKVVLTTPYRHRCGYGQAPPAVRMLSQTVALDPSRELTSIQLPALTDTWRGLRIFAVTLGAAD